MLVARPTLCRSAGGLKRNAKICIAALRIDRGGESRGGTQLVQIEALCTAGPVFRQAPGEFEFKAGGRGNFRDKQLKMVGNQTYFWLELQLHHGISHTSS